MNVNSSGKRRTVAVIGSLAMLGGTGTALAATDGGTTKAASDNASKAPAKTWADHDGLSTLTSGERTALEAAHAAIAAQAGAIATPILAEAVTAGTITAAQETEFLARLSRTSTGRSGGRWQHSGATGASSFAGWKHSDSATTRTAPSAAARAVFVSVRTAVDAQAVGIATPVLDAAVTAATITPAQETTLLGFLDRAPLRDGGRHWHGARR